MVVILLLGGVIGVAAWWGNRHGVHRRVRVVAVGAVHAGTSRPHPLLVRVFPTWLGPRGNAPRVPLLPRVVSHLRSGQLPRTVWDSHGVLTVAGIPVVQALAHRLAEDDAAQRTVRVPPRDRCHSFQPADASAQQAARAVVAACRLSSVTGLSLATVLDTTAAALRRATDARSARTTATAGAEATARLLLLLPLFALLMGYALGAQPLTWLTRTPLGWGSLIAAIVFLLAGRAWVARLLASATTTERAPTSRGPTSRGSRTRARAVANPPPSPPPIDVTITLDLLTTVMSAGHSIDSALDTVATHVPDLEVAQLGVVARLLLLGASWQRAWANAPARYAFLGEALADGWQRGSSVIPTLIATRDAWIAQEQADAHQRAQRLSSMIVVPVGVCYLPAFVLVGVVPTAVSLGVANFFGG